MTTLRYATDANSLLKGARNLIAFAPKRCWEFAPWCESLPESVAAMLQALGKRQNPGDLGSVGSSLLIDNQGKGLEKVSAAVLPDSGSRYNSPARAAAIAHTAQSTGLGKRERAAVLLVLEDETHLLPAVNALGRALHLTDWKSAPKKPRKVSILAVDTAGAPLKIPAPVRATLSATRRAAEFVDMPPSELHPTAFAKAARKWLSSIEGLQFKELHGPALVKAKLGAIHGVGKAATNGPRLFTATLTPRGAAKGRRHIALVGKGITYDTGGLHLKPRGGMEGMKADMGGAAAVLGAFQVLAQERPKHKISLLLALAENAIGPLATKPDDILHMHSGHTVEINNTDAEGRLVLGDAVSYAVRNMKADTVIDAATLTGAQLVSTGIRHAAVMSNDGELEQALIDSGRDSGDLTHALPFAPEFYQSEFKSPVADMRNSVKNRMNAQASCAGQFIYAQLDDTDARWAHVDLAGPAFLRDRGTGFGVALLSECVRRL